MNDALFLRAMKYSLCLQSPPLCFHYDVMDFQIEIMRRKRRIIFNLKFHYNIMDFQIVIMTRERVIIYNLKIHYIRNENREEEIILNNGTGHYHTSH